MVKLVIGRKNPVQGSPFGSKQVAPINSELADTVASANRRLKMVEERYTNLRNRFGVIEQNMLHKNRNISAEFKTFNLEITELKKEINELKDNIIRIVKEIDSYARKESVDVLKKYIDLWAPIKFVTHSEVEEVVREVIEKMRREG